jgi:hypothetical protein
MNLLISPWKHHCPRIISLIVRLTASRGSHFLDIGGQRRSCYQSTKIGHSCSSIQVLPIRTALVRTGSERLWQAVQSSFELVEMLGHKAVSILSTGQRNDTAAIQQMGGQSSQDRLVAFMVACPYRLFLVLLDGLLDFPAPRLDTQITKEFGHRQDLLRQKGIKDLHVGLLIAEHGIVGQILDHFGDQQQSSADFGGIRRDIKIDLTGRDYRWAEEAKKDERADHRVTRLWESICSDLPQVMAQRTKHADVSNTLCAGDPKTRTKETE